MNSDSNFLSTYLFFDVNFTTDDFLSKCTQKSDLLTLRKDLKNYGQELYNIMVNILKCETEDIVNLAESLSNLSLKIDDLSSPVAQLYEETKILYLSVSKATQIFEKQFKSAQTTNDRIYGISLKIGIVASSLYIDNIIQNWIGQDITILEQAVNEYSVQFLYLREVGLEQVTVDNNEKENVFRLLQLISKFFIKAIESNNEDVMVRCLRMYVNLNSQNMAERCVRKQVVKPSLDVIVTQKTLDELEQDIQKLYVNILDIIGSKLNTLLEVVEKNSDLKGFNFIVNSYWYEIDKQLQDKLADITAPGNPERFQSRYRSTWRFITQIIQAAKCSSLYQSEPTFQVHLKRFNLLVYFEIRFQQIVAKFETAIYLFPLDVLSAKNDDKFHLKITSALLSGIKRCFHEDVFLLPLCDQFVKLSMLLLSRYIKWFTGRLEAWVAESDQMELEKIEPFLIYSLIDVDSITNLIGFSCDDITQLENTIFKIVVAQLKAPLVQVLNINKMLLNGLYSNLQKTIITFKMQRSALHLQQVCAIPRLYRRTNRSVPKEPSHYIVKVAAPLTKLYDDYVSVAGDRIIAIMDVIIVQLGKQYTSLVQEVLHSVCKTEESLRRLKNRNLGNNDELQTTQDATSDETKIREQLKLDVGYFYETLKPYAASESTVTLKHLMEESGLTINV